MKWKRMYSVALVISLLLIGIARYALFPRDSYPEVRELAGKSLDFGELSVFFTRLAQAKGASYAFEVLRIATLPPNTDMHLLGHVVGDELYKQQGINGMSACTQDFRNACSHSIVVGYFLAKGEEGLGDIANACRRAPGGAGAYTMCFHGLGHGILAAVDYDLPRAVSLCQKTGTIQYGYRESSECTSGTVMEIISGGFHNKTLWEKQSAKYLSLSEPLLPCTASYVPAGSKPQCFEYLTPHLVKAAGGSLDDGVPADEILKKAFAYCELLDIDIQRAFCYQGFGKEFIVLVHNRDTRTLANMDEREMKETFRLCALAGRAQGERECLLHAMDSLFWGGENDPTGAVRFCALMESETLAKACYEHLVGATRFFLKDPHARDPVCKIIPGAYQRDCYE